ncbi:hypothetical protein AAC387_Pa01g2869 [Persea americana]
MSRHREKACMTDSRSDSKAGLLSARWVYSISIYDRVETLFKLRPLIGAYSASAH